MANIDRILNIHQSFTQEKISALNKEILKAQYIQATQISQLQKQLDASNAMSREILNNQLKELKHREAQKHYKALAFNINTLLECISELNASAVKIFLFDFYSPVISSCIIESRDSLDEINDKTYCNELETKVAQIKHSLAPHATEYKNTSFSTLLEQEKEYHSYRVDAIKEISILKAQPKPVPVTQTKPLKTQATPKSIKKSTLWIWGILSVLSIFAFIPTFIVWIVLMVKYRKQQRLKLQPNNTVIQETEIIECPTTAEPVETVEDKIARIEESINTHSYIKTKQLLSDEYPDWESAMEQSFIFFAKINPTSTQRYNDFSLLHEVTEYIVKKKSASIREVQKKCTMTDNTVGYNRVQQCLGLLEKYKVVLRNADNSYTALVTDVVVARNVLQYVEKDCRVADEDDELLFDVAKFVVMQQNASTSTIQRKFSIGYNRAGRMVDALANYGVIAKVDGKTPPKVLVQDMDALYQMLSK